MSREDKKKLLEKMKYPEERQEEFLDNANVTKHSEYYWTYKEQGHLVRCMLLSEMGKMFE